MRVRVEKRLLIALSVDVDQKRPQVTQQRLRRELIVNEDLVASVDRQFAANDQLVAVLQTGIFQQRFELRIRSQRKQSFDRTALRSRLQQLAREAPTDQNTKRIDDDRLARSCFTFEQIQRAVKFHSQIINQCNVGNTEELQHCGPQISRPAQICNCNLCRSS